MIEIRLIPDASTVAEVMTHPKVWPWIVDDGLPVAPPAGFQVPAGAGIEYVGLYHQGKLVGVWRFDRRTEACYEAHTMLLPEARGRVGVDGAQACAAWFWQNHPRAARLVTMVPSDNRPALLFAEWAGMKAWGMNPQSFRRAGTLHDEIWLGMSRPKEA